MRKLFLFIMACLSLSSIQAQSKQEKEFGFFNSLAIGANVGTTGWGIDVATPLGNHLALRAGFTIMPTVTKNTAPKKSLRGLITLSMRFITPVSDNMEPIINAPKADEKPEEETEKEPKSEGKEDNKAPETPKNENPKK